MEKIYKLLSFIYSYSLIKKITYRLDKIYSHSIRREFKECGKNFSIKPGLELIGGKYISIGDDFTCYGRLRIEAYDRHLNDRYSPKIVIGNNVSFNYDCHIGCVNEIIIGDNVLIGSKVFITDHYHGKIVKEELGIAANKREVFSKGKVIIEDNVWIGEGVAIMPNVVIGKNSIIGANAVVTKNIPENCVVGGIPAKIIKKLI